MYLNKNMKKVYFLAILTTVFLLSHSIELCAQQKSNKKPNILFFAIDDLKPLLGCYGNKMVHSPNIDKLAEYSTVYYANYCQQAICGPTRASILTGLRPDKTKIWVLNAVIREKNPTILTLPQYFKQNGYTTAAIGKIFHKSNVDKLHDSVSWTKPYRSESKYEYPEKYGYPLLGQYQSEILKKEFQNKDNNTNDDEESKKSGKLTSSECIDVEDDAYVDGQIAIEAIEDLKQFSTSNKPFFLAVGFHKPHLPFVAPKKYWDLYDRNKMDLATWQQPSIDGPKIAYHNSNELRSYTDIKSMSDEPMLKLDSNKQKELIHAYYACVSYTDAQIGKVLDELKKQGLDKNTIIVLWGDHGWHLGDHSLWHKHTNFEQATKAPLIISAAGQTKGYVYNGQTEHVDVFPTLCELSGLTIPNGLDGVSLAKTTRGDKKAVKEYSISQWPKNLNKGENAIMGYTIRTERYRYTEWVGKDFRTTKHFNKEDITDAELYDYKIDPNETHNYLNNQAYKSVRDDMSKKLHDFYLSQEIK